MLGDVIKKGFDYDISNIEVEDDNTGKQLEYLDDLKKKMTITVHYVLNLERKVSFSANYKILANRKIEQLGVPSWTIAKVKPLEDTVYLDEAIKSANQIAQNISNALAKNLCYFNRFFTIFLINRRHYRTQNMVLATLRVMA